jgi:hypothetical protein
MPGSLSLLERIQARVRARDYRFTVHAGDRMTQRYVSVRDVEQALLSTASEVIENYPADPRGPSCLVFGFTAFGRPLHVQCTYRPNVAIVTAYEPDPEEWTDWRVRKEV